MKKLAENERELDPSKEIAILQALNGGPNIVDIIAVVKSTKTKRPVIVTEFIEQEELDKIQNTLNEEEIRHYIYQILKALDYANSKGIVHRDLKMVNIAIDHPNRKLYVLDWGMAEFYHPGEDNSRGRFSIDYFTPELLFGKKVHNYALDIWSLGCIFA